MPTDIPDDPDPQDGDIDFLDDTSGLAALDQDAATYREFATRVGILYAMLNVAGLSQRVVEEVTITWAASYFDNVWLEECE